MFFLGLSPLILVTGFVILLTWLFKFWYGRRKMYKMAKKIQGPAGIPVFGNALEFLGKDTVGFFKIYDAYFRTYPDIFKIWLGPVLAIGIGKPEYAEILLNHPSCLDKGLVYHCMKCYLGEGLITAPESIWRKHRKLITPTFNQKTLDKYVEIFTGNAVKLLEALKTKTGEKNVDLLRFATECSLANICAETTMGVKVGAQNITKKYGAILSRCMELATVRMFHLIYHQDFVYKFTKSSKEICRLLSILHHFTDKVIADRRSIILDRRDKIDKGEIIEDDESKLRAFLDFLLAYTGDQKMSNTQMRDEVNTLIAAGSDTTARTTCFCILAMGLFPEIQQKVYQEIIEVVGEDRDVTAADLPRLQYMEKVIKETLRVFPVVPMFFRTVSSDVILGDNLMIPKDTMLMFFNPYMHKNEKYWKDPLKFDPDRFSPEEVCKRNPYCFAPFAGGPRSCIGQRYSYMAIKTMLSTVLRKIEVKCEYESIEEVELQLSIVIQPVDGFKVSVKLRE